MPHSAEYLARTRDTRLAQMRARYQRCREEALERQAAWRERNPGAYMEWARANPNKTRARDATRRARKLGAFVERVLPSTVYEMHGGMCGICEEFIDGDFHVDHVVPLARGGEHSYANTQPAHPVCNLRKGARA